MSPFHHLKSYQNMFIKCLKVGRIPVISLSHVRKYTDVQNCPTKFEPVFSFPTIKYIALLNRLKVYHFIGTGVVVPSCGLLEMFSVVPQNTFFSAAYIGITGAAVLSLATLPFRNIIGHLYISEDNSKIKISSLDFWGRRVDRIIDSDDWVPLLDMESKKTDVIYLSPQTSDGSKYKLFVRFGKVLNSRKIGQVLE